MSILNSHRQQEQEFPPPETFRTLTVRDLFEVRDLYHAHLSNMPNVIGTAIGLYRFRFTDQARLLDKAIYRAREKTSTERTLFNSRVTDESHPAILVFVRKWIPYKELPDDPRYVIPQLLYLKDGRVVPTCIIRMELDPAVDITSRDVSHISFPENLIGGGCGIYTRVQGQQHVGTLACLATDGERLYGLSARHVVGPAGQPIYTRIRGKETFIGTSDSGQIKKKPFAEIYPDYASRESLSTLDAGLIRIEEADWWTSQVLHIGQLDDLVNLHTHNINLGMIGCHLRASGAVSGDRMRGEIIALFPRYRGMGGVDYLADLLIGPSFGQDSNFSVAGGDSGALWVLDKSGEGELAKPVAITWGSVDLSGGTSKHLVLASFVSTVCKALEIELVTRQNIGYRPVWGAKNHVFLASIAADLLPGDIGNLKAFLLGSNGQPEHREALKKLAVLPDDWRRKPGRDEEGPNHYSDIDIELNGKRLADIDLTADAWKQYYQSLQNEVGDTEKISYGALPFRIGQVFDCIVDYLRNNNYDWAYAAAGALIHYVSDACNPAHVTLWTKGDPSWTSSQGRRFHSICDNETTIDVPQVQNILSNLAALPAINDGNAARRLALDLMTTTLNTVNIGPFVVSDNTRASYENCRNYIESAEGQQNIASVVAHGCRLLFTLWKDAWGLGNGSALTNQIIDGIDVTKLYDMVLREPKFLPSVSLKKI